MKRRSIDGSDSGDSPIFVEGANKKRKGEKDAEVAAAEEVVVAELGEDLVFEVLKRADARTLARAACVCRLWRRLAGDERLWEAVWARHWAYIRYSNRMFRSVIEAHGGGINDAAYSQPNRQVCIVTGGEDKTIKVWDAAIGTLLYTFKGHETPVYSICPHPKASIFFSASLDGKIKAWMYDNVRRLDHTIPGQWCITLAYSADGTRLFSCVARKDLMPHIVELNDYNGTIMQIYHGLCKQAVGTVKFDSTKNWLLAAGDEHMVKFWDMDNTNLLQTTDADGDLPASPCIRFNKDGSLLAVSANNNDIKILANVDGEVLLIANAEPASGSIPKASTGTSASDADKGAPVATAGASEI